METQTATALADPVVIGLYSSLDRPYYRYKRHLDRLLAALLLVPGLPLIGFLIVLIRLTSRGPGIYRQQRVGKGGRVFWMLKLRSMRMDAEVRTGPAWTADCRDPRITRLGRLLRFSHLDELPQLFNVLKGEMSLIGPRPERPEFVRILRREIPGYTDRLAVLPGVTGLAQINLPADTDFDSVRRKLLLDREYINTASLSLDVRISLCTLLRLAGIRAGRAVCMLRLDRKVVLPGHKTPAEDSPGMESEPATLDRLAAVAAARHAGTEQTQSCPSSHTLNSKPGQHIREPLTLPKKSQDTQVNNRPPELKDTREIRTQKPK